MQGIATLSPRSTFEVRKALIRLAKSKIWSLIEKVTKTLTEGFRSPRRNKLRYAQYNQRLNCWTLRYCSLIEKILGFFRRGEAAKILRAVVLTIAYRFELASTRSPAESRLSKTTVLWFLLWCRVRSVLVYHWINYGENYHTVFHWKSFNQRYVLHWLTNEKILICNHIKT